MTGRRSSQVYSRYPQMIGRKSARIFGLGSLLVLWSLVAGFIEPVEGQEFDDGVLTLEEALTLAERWNPAYRRALADRRAADAGVRAGYGAFLPSLNASLGWGGGSSTTLTGTDDFGQSVRLPNPISFSSSSASQSLSSSMTIFDGFQNLNSARAARFDADAAEYAVADAVVAMDAEVKRRFFLVVNSQRLIDVERELLVSRENSLEVNERLFAIAGASQSDVLGAQIDVAAQQQQLEVAIGNAQKNRLQLLEQVGLLEETHFEVAGVFPEPFDPSQLDVERLVIAAIERNPIMERSAAQRLSALRRTSAARGARLPRISLNGSFSRGAQEQGFGAIGNLNPLNRGFNFSTSIQLPLFSGFQTSQNIAQATAGLQNAEEALRETQLRLEQQVRSAFIDLENAYQALLIQRRSTAFSRRRVELSQEEFRQGSIAFVNLQPVVDQAANQERALVNAEYDFAVALVTLEERVGTSIPRPEQ